MPLSCPSWIPVPPGIGIITGITVPGAVGTMPGIIAPGITTPGTMNPGIGETLGTGVTVTAIIIMATAISTPGITALGTGIPGIMIPGLGDTMPIIPITAIMLGADTVVTITGTVTWTSRRTMADKAWPARPARHRPLEAVLPVAE